MKTLAKSFLSGRVVALPLIYSLFLIIGGCGKNAENPQKATSSDNDSDKLQEESIWHVKAFLPEGKLLDIKALDTAGHIYEVKAIQKDDNFHLMDIKALVGGKKLPVKMLVSDDLNIPVKAIGEDGTIYDIKALTPEGDKLDVKGTTQNGNIIQIKAISRSGALYGVKALSREGQLYDVKGIKLSNERIEAKINGVDVYAHIKALPQIGQEETDSIWHVKAVHPDGRLLDVKALDKEDKINDVKAFVTNGELHLMDIKALINGKKQPVKMLVSNDLYVPVKAIGDDGTIYDIKALTPEGERLDVKGINPSGNIIQIKAIDQNRQFYGIKAISPRGNLHDIKGVKLSEERVEMVLHGVEVFAHIKALPVVVNSNK